MTASKAPAAMAALRSTGSAQPCTMRGTKRACQRAWYSGSWSWQAWPSARNAAYLTRMCWSSDNWSNNAVMVSNATPLSTNSTAARIAMAAASFPSHRAPVAYLWRSSNKALPVFSKPNFPTKRSTLASPDRCKPPSSSSCSSSSTPAHASSSSTSQRNSKAMAKAFCGRSGTALTRAFPFDSATVETHSKAKLLFPSSMVPFAPAKANIISTHSRYLGLKKIACSAAHETSDCKASSKADESLDAMALNACSTNGKMGCIASSDAPSRTDTNSATRPNAAACKGAVARPVFTNVPSSWRWARTACVWLVPLSSVSNRSDDSWWQTLVLLPSANAFGTSSAQGASGVTVPATAAMPEMRIFRTLALVSVSRDWNKAAFI
mmetsp:Transcript_8067/g.20073  ORF Transcript_8067/g.20073 Transcript_8067/m.20073 type:complete len:379 (+) Transcript_8067:185-1321(+)